MCQHISGIAVKDGESVKVFTCADGQDSHEAIREEHNIRDDGSAGATRQTPVELVPIGDVSLREPETWTFKFDDARPTWWTDEMTSEAVKQLAAAERKLWRRNTLAIPGALDLRTVTTIPAGVTLSAGGYLDLSSVTTIPAGVTLSAGRYLDLSSVTTIPQGVTLSAGGSLYLPSVTTIPQGVTLSVGGDLDLPSVTTIPQGVTLSAGRYLYLSSVTTIGEGVKIKAQGVKIKAQSVWNGRNYVSVSDFCGAVKKGEQK